MGMDVFGNHPENEKGEHFRVSWRPRPMADFVCDIAPDITDRCLYRHSDDGDGLNKRNSKRLAEVVRQAVQEGGFDEWAAETGEWKEAVVGKDERSRMPAHYDLVGYFRN